MKEIKLPDLKGLVEHVSKEIYERVQRRTPVDSGRAQNGWELKVEGTKAEISNQVPYIGILEEGSSQQAPNGMVRVTLEEVPQIISTYREQT